MSDQKERDFALRGADMLEEQCQDSALLPSASFGDFPRAAPLTLDDLVAMLEERGQRLTFAVMLHLPGGAGVIDVTRNLMAGGFEFTFGVSEPEKAEVSGK